MRGEGNHSSCFAGSPVEDEPLPEMGASVPRFLETRKLGLAGPPFLQVNQLNSGEGERYWFSFPASLLFPPPLHSLPQCTANHPPCPLAKVT